MSLSEESLAILDSLREPVFLLELTGKIAAANRVARDLVGPAAVGGDMVSFLNDPAGFSAYLRRCAGTTGPLPGSISLRTREGGERKLRAYGSRLRESGGSRPGRILLRLVSNESDGFSALAEQIRALNAEIRRRQRAQAALEEALNRNETLFRELQHRVKNNVQMLLGLFAAAKRETRHEEVRVFLEEVAARLSAVIAAQQLMYQARDLEVVPAESFLHSLCDAVAKTHGHSARLSVSAYDGALSNDVVLPLALILSELLTNAYKYGTAVENGAIKVDLSRDGPEYVLTISDNGPGMPDAAVERRSSGLGLVRGLCRQIRGSLKIDTDAGTRCTVRFLGPSA